MTSEATDLQTFLILFPAALAWVASGIVASVIVRRRKGLPIFPKAPDDALYSERAASGASRKNALTRIGGASNCLIVAVTTDRLTIVPQFPFNLMFLPEFYDLQHQIARRDIHSVRVVGGLFGQTIIVEFETSAGGRREVQLRLKRPDDFLRAVGKSV